MIPTYFGKCKAIFIETIHKLKGSDKRKALAKIAKSLGKGGQSTVAKEFNVSRNTIRKGRFELKGISIADAFNARGRKGVEVKLPNLLEDITDIIDTQSQTDPDFGTTRLFTRVTVKEVRKQLIGQKGYTDEELPVTQTLNNKINKLGYRLQKVQKAKPLKKIAETDAIFDHLKKVHDENKDKDNVVRISIDTKDRVKIGNFSRGGKSRNLVKANDHDFGNDYVTPFGILDLTSDHLELVFTETKATADFMVDCIEAYWCKHYLHTKDTLIINADNGPENSSRRTQFMKRIIEFSATYHIKVILAYFPPYHSKYNPVERAWGRLEQHWNGDILDTLEAVLGFAKSMVWKGKNPTVSLSENVYETGVKVKKSIMNYYEQLIERAAGIEKWFVTIDPKTIRNGGLYGNNSIVS
ncbi:ISAzo13 family transposase [Sporosarcina limicola]|uniref:Transposase n=1 Tax=Sporosarcina limicola TaxID=34101 RepID=A0A927MKS7_9BACL|nr:ISAzo13 family transposase [Sporosarcina limicola]MBE1556564.1 hypothetical protein [Sporosarcina limicola]